MIKELKFKWKDLKNEEVIAIPAVGNYEKFVTENYMNTTGFYDPKTMIFTSCEDRYIKMLNEGKVLFNKGYLVFKEGFQQEYKSYANEFISNVEDKKLLDSLNDVKDYSFVSNMLKIVKRGVVSKEHAITILSKYFKSEDYLVNCI